jgi:hypothetical protein
MAGDEALPGLAPPAPPAPPASRLLEAVERTIADLVARGFVDNASDAGKIELARELSAIIADKRTRGRTSTVAMDARVLLDLLAGFDERAAGVDGALESAMQSWSEEIQTRLAGGLLELPAPADESSG